MKELIKTQNQGGSKMEYKEIKVSELKENPKNNKYFSDISEESERNWNAFIENIRAFGILEPLLIRQDTMTVTSGHQRLKAAIEIGKEIVPCVLYNPETDQEDEIKLLSTNIFRRKEPDFFVYAAYIEMMRTEYDPDERGDDGFHPHPEESIQSLAEDTGKEIPFVSSVDVYNLWSEEEKKVFNEWYEKQEQKPTDVDIQEEIKNLEHESLIKGKDIRELNNDIRQRQNEIDKLKEEMKKSGENKNDEIRELKSEKTKLATALKKEKDKTDVDVQIEKLFKALPKLITESAKFASNISSCIDTFTKLGVNSLRGGDAKMTEMNFSVVEKQIDRFISYFNINLLEEIK